MNRTVKTAILPTITVTLLLICNGLSGQNYLNNPAYGSTEEERTKCASNLSTMSEYVKINMLDYAYDGWRYCFFYCPGASRNIYVMGARILKHRIDNAPDAVIASAYLDTLMMLYDRRIEHFKQEGFVLGWKGMDLLRYRPDSPKEAYEILKTAISIDRDNSDAPVFSSFFQAAFVHYRNGELTADDFIADYLMVAEHLDKAIQNPSKAKEADNYKLVLGNAESLFAESGAATCESLNTIFKPKYEATPEDIELLKKITELFDKTRCSESDLYALAAEALYKLEPSARAAYNLGNLFEVRGELNKAKDYLALAANQEENAEDRATYFFRRANISYRQGNYQDTRSDALSAIASKPVFGDAYLLIGTAYIAGNATCNNDDFERASTYWAAIDKFNKAKVVDPSVTDKANDLIAKFVIYYPTREEVFFRNLQDGQAYTIGCWINENTTVRTRR